MCTLIGNVMSQDQHDKIVNACKDALRLTLNDALSTLDKHYYMQRQRLVDEYKNSLRLISANVYEDAVKVNDPSTSST